MSQNKLAGNKRVTAKTHITLFVFMLYYFLVVPFALYPLFNAVGLTSSTIGAVVISGFYNLLPLLVYLLISRQRPKAILPPISLGMKNAIYIVLATIAANFIVLFVNFGHFNTLFNGVTPEPIDMPGIGSIWMPLIAFGFLTATFEELWYRGPIYSEYKKHGVSIWKIVLISGILFGVIHSGAFQISYTAVLGVLWAFMLYYTRSIWAPILAHVVFNSLNILLNPIFYLNDYNVFWNNLQTYTLIFGIAALVMIPIAIVCVRKLITNNPVEKETPTGETKLFTVGYWVLLVLMVVVAVLFRI